MRGAAGPTDEPPLAECGSVRVRVLGPRSSSEGRRLPRVVRRSDRRRTSSRGGRNTPSNDETSRDDERIAPPPRETLLPLGGTSFVVGRATPPVRRARFRPPKDVFTRREEHSFERRDLAGRRGKRSSRPVKRSFHLAGARSSSEGPRLPLVVGPSDRRRTSSNDARSTPSNDETSWEETGIAPHGP